MDGTSSMDTAGEVLTQPIEKTAEAAPKYKKGNLPPLRRSTTAEEALARIVLGCVDHLRGNEACVLARAHEEGVHQMRVAVRRLRSCLALYKDFIPTDQRVYLSGELRWLIGELGPARDWDVFVGEILGPVMKQMAHENRLEALREAVERLRDDAYRRARDAIGSNRYYGLVMLLGAWAEGRRWREQTLAHQPHGTQIGVVDVAHRLLDDLLSAVRTAGEGFEELDADQRHKVRIQIKKLRYAIEFFFSLYPQRRVRPYLAALKSLQDDLGANNDVEVARKLLKKTVRESSGKEKNALLFASGLVVGWHSHVGDDRERRLGSDWRAFIGRPPFWNGQQSQGAAASGATATAEGATGGVRDAVTAEDARAA